MEVGHLGLEVLIIDVDLDEVSDEDEGNNYVHHQLSPVLALNRSEKVSLALLKLLVACIIAILLLLKVLLLLLLVPFLALTLL